MKPSIVTYVDDYSRDKNGRIPSTVTNVIKALIDPWRFRLCLTHVPGLGVVVDVDNVYAYRVGKLNDSENLEWLRDYLERHGFASIPIKRLKHCAELVTLWLGTLNATRGSILSQMVPSG